MSVIFHVVKCSVFSCNILCLILGIGVIAVNALGLERSLPNTDEHTYFIVGTILGSLVCMTTLFGCYGVICELLGVNVIYALFILILLLMQYLQMQTYPTHVFYVDAVERLEHAWRLVESQPYLMHTVEHTYNCCALYDSRDYNYKGLTVPKSCYVNYDVKDPTYLHPRGCLEVLHEFYQFAIHREKLCNWALFGTECFVFVYTCILGILIYKQNNRRYVNHQREVDHGPVAAPIMNHTGSRIALLSD